MIDKDAWVARWVPSDLPAPDADAIAVSQRLIDQLAGQIASDGPMLFSAFMGRLLYSPGLGYYTAGSTKFGAAGDFITAPELSPYFGRCLAAFCDHVLAESNGDTIVELGAGSGALARQILSATDRTVRYCIVETSADLRERQQQALSDVISAGVQVDWLDAPPQNWRGVLLANEVVDALPVALHDAGGDENRVLWQDGRFAWEGADVVEPVISIPNVSQWLQAVTGGLRQGAVLFLDYGGSSQEMALRGNGLRCYYRHRVHGDPLILPGLQDITADVDFSALAAAAHTAALELAGYTTQANFLLGLGLDQMLSEVAGQMEPKSLKLLQGAKTLLMPDEMGERIKAIAFSKGTKQLSLPGFQRNLSGRL